MGKNDIIGVVESCWKQDSTDAINLISAGQSEKNYTTNNPSFFTPASNFNGGIFVKISKYVLPTTPEQIKSSVKVDENGCWLYQGRICKTTGYANHHNKWIHRASYEIFKGPIPEGLQIDHLCMVRSCVNPDHLEAVTHKVNTLRGNSISAINARKTHCPKGHPYEGSNLLGHNPSVRLCKTCHREGEFLRKRLANGIPLEINHDTHCKNGHIRTVENTYIRPDNGYRMCKDCNVLYRAKNKKAS
jgi:hypothetical protein